MKLLFKNKKALSPVVAAIILVAVTVAVSVAVSAWIGSFAIGNMQVNELTITEVEFTIGDALDGRINVFVINSGTSDVTVNRIRVNGENAVTWSSGTSDTIDAGGNETFTITHTVALRNKYCITLYTSDGTMVGSYTSTA